MSTALMNERVASIGEAAALYDLAPSTVRWWEHQNVLDHPARHGGRRVYHDADLRRIGVAYLCCVVGKMPLDEAAVVTSGKAPHDVWQRTVSEQILLLNQRIEQLEAARDYLQHLLCCEDDDMAECRFLEGELAARTPRGRVAERDLVAAAHAARTTGQSHEEAPPRDETATDRASCDDTPAPCAACQGPVTRTARGRPRTYCSRACQQRAYRARRNQRS